MGQAVKILPGLADRGDQRVISKLLSMGGDRQEDYRAGTFRSADASVRQAAIEALSDLTLTNDDHFTGALTSILDDHDQGVRLAVLDALLRKAEKEDLRAIQIVLERLKHRKANVSQEAAEALTSA